MIDVTLESEIYTSTKDSVIRTNCLSFVIINEGDANVTILDATIAPGKEFRYESSFGTRVTGNITFRYATGVTVRKLVVIREIPIQ